MSSWVVSALRRIISNSSVLSDGRNLSQDYIDSCVLMLELVYREFMVKATVNGSLLDYEEEAAHLVYNALQLFVTIRDHSDVGIELNYSPPLFMSGAVGRPRYMISRDQLELLVENHFTVPQISCILGVSVRTVERRLHDNGISIRSRYADLTDAELNRLVEDIQSEYPGCGNRQMKGHLLSRGFRVQQSRIREAQRTVDPEGSILRTLYVRNRRSYSVPAPRSLWHIDGNHKLIR